MSSQAAKYTEKAISEEQPATAGPSAKTEEDKSELKEDSKTDAGTGKKSQENEACKIVAEISESKDNDNDLRPHKDTKIEPRSFQGKQEVDSRLSASRPESSEQQMPTRKRKLTTPTRRSPRLASAPDNIPLPSRNIDQQVDSSRRNRKKPTIALFLDSTYQRKK